MSQTRPEESGLKEIIPSEDRAAVIKLLEQYIKEKKLSKEDSFHLRYFIGMLQTGEAALGRAYDQNKISSKSRKHAKEFEKLNQERDEKFQAALADFEKQSGDRNTWKFDQEKLKQLTTNLSELSEKKKLESQLNDFFNWASKKTEDPKNKNHKLHDLFKNKKQQIQKGMVNGFLFNLAATFFPKHYKPEGKTQAEINEMKLVTMGQSNLLKRVATAVSTNTTDNIFESIMDDIKKKGKGLTTNLQEGDLFDKVSGKIKPVPGQTLQGDIEHGINLILNDIDFRLMTASHQIKLLSELKTRLDGLPPIQEAKDIYTAILEGQIQQIKAAPVTVPPTNQEVEQGVKETAARVAQKKQTENEQLQKPVVDQKATEEMRKKARSAFNTLSTLGSLAKSSGKQLKAVLNSKIKPSESTPEPSPRQSVEPEPQPTVETRHQMTMDERLKSLQQFRAEQMAKQAESQAESKKPEQTQWHSATPKRK